VLVDHLARAPRQRGRRSLAAPRRRAPGAAGAQTKGSRRADGGRAAAARAARALQGQFSRKKWHTTRSSPLTSAKNSRSPATSRYSPCPRASHSCGARPPGGGARARPCSGCPLGRARLARPQGTGGRPARCLPARDGQAGPHGTVTAARQACCPWHVALLAPVHPLGRAGARLAPRGVRLQLADPALAHALDIVLIQVLECLELAVQLALHLGGRLQGSAPCDPPYGAGLASLPATV
jgi:hypothetical protein